MQRDWIVVHGILRQGYGVASGPSRDYPYGALERQLPIFAARGLDLRNYYLGTLNIDISPKRFEVIAAEYTFRDVLWTDLHPPEHFSFARCQVGFEEGRYEGWIYYPHPETKLRHFQDASLVEVIAPWMDGLAPGSALDLHVNPEQILIHAGSKHAATGPLD